MHKVRTKWAVARIKWDDEYGEAGSWHPLNLGLYEKQDGDKPQHQGRCLPKLNSKVERYIQFVQRHKWVEYRWKPTFVTSETEARRKENKKLLLCFWDNA